MTPAHPWSQRWGISPAAAAALEQALAALPDPEEARRVLEPLLEALADVRVSPALLDAPLAAPALARLACAAPFLLRHAARFPQRLEQGLLADLRDPSLPAWPEDGAGAGPPALGEPGLAARMRLWKYDCFLRLTAQDLLGLAHTARTCAALSRVAERLIQAALAQAFATQVARHGLPLNRDGTLALPAVLAMGKLGGGELNYASDVDLILLHSGDDAPCVPQAVALEGAMPGSVWPLGAGVSGPGAAVPGESIMAPPDGPYWERWQSLAAAQPPAPAQSEAISNGEFHQRVGRELIRLLEARTEEGTGFRVDVDLRPQGRSGLLVPPLRLAVQYYDLQGREWERVAMIKARPVAGSPAVWQPFLDAVRPFVYRRYLDYGALEGVVLIKHDIDRHHGEARQGDLKLGRGGIRECEFAVQALQLLHGGRVPALQVPGQAAALGALVRAGLVPEAEGGALLQDYWTLRQHENRAQMLDEAQVHALPEDPALRLRVLTDFQPGFAARLPQVLERLEAARQRVRRRFEGLFAGPGLAPAAEARAWEDAVRQHAGAEAPELLARIHALLSRLMRTREGERCVFKAERLLARPELYQRGSDDAFPRWLAFLEQIGNRNSLYSLMEAHAGTVAWASHIFAEGGKHAPLLIRHPEFLESYLDLASAPAEPFARRFQAILHSARDEEELILDVQMAKARALMQILTAYLEVGEQAGHRRMLSDLADATVAVCAGLAWRQVAARLGEPTLGAGGGGELPGFAVLAMGKLGSQELRFGSDLDLVFVYDRDGGTARGRSHLEFYTKVGQRLSSLLTSPTQFGALQELDHRLRPFGSKGVLVPSLAAYESFLREAEVWNFQAFTRIRHVCGDADLSRRLVTATGQAWQARHPDPAQTARAVRGMLGRLVAQHAPRPLADRPEPGAPLQLKYAVGGLIGFEFLRQCWFLRVRAAPGGDWTPPEDHAIISRLLPAYQMLGALDERVSCHVEPYRHAVHPQDFQRIAAVRARWDYQTVMGVCQELENQVEEGFSALTS